MTTSKSISSRAAMMLLLMLLTSVSAWAQDSDDYPYCGDPDDNDGQNVTWSLSGTLSSGTLIDCTLTISGTGAMANYDFFDDSDESPWYRYIGYITSIVIKDGVTSIGENAFIGCNALKTVTIGNGVKTIGENAFYGCSALGTVTIPDNVKTIGDYAFIGCTALETVTIGNGVETIGDGAFSGCPITTLSINMENISDEAFLGSSLSTVTFGTNVKTIGEGAFFGCTNLGTVTIPDNVKTIGTDAFLNCI